jgi:hypothetical protein
MIYDYLEYRLNSCEELLQFLTEVEHDENPFITADFQGDAIVTKKVVCLADLNGGEIVYCKKLGRTFIIGPRRDKWFLICLYGNTKDMEITIGVDVPSYCRDEMICTIKDDWDNWLG